jgi:Leucine-rich repeat (LRR) protein
MKRLLSFLLFILISCYSNAQVVDIPDANFESKLLEADVTNTIAKDLAGNFFKIDANNDGEIQDSEALTVLYLDVKGEGSGDTNIVSLIGIEAFSNIETLDCSWNDFTNLDVTQNVNLKTLICRSYDDSEGSLTSLDVSTLVNLQTLNCSNHGLTSLDVTQNLDLQILDCSNNNFSSLDVTQNINLETLNCKAPDYHGDWLTSLDVSTLVNLKVLDCSNYNLASLDVTQNTNLEILNCEGKSDGDLSGLTDLDLTQNLNLQTLNCAENQLTSLDVTQNINLQDLRFERNFLTNIDLTNNLTLQTLVCYVNDLSSLDVSQNINLQILNCAANELTSLDVSQNVNLQELRCSINLLTSLDVAQNSGLQIIDCANNELNSLDVSQNANLHRLSFSNNQLTTIDVTQNVDLDFLSVDGNQLTTLDLSENVSLGHVDCFGNQLTTIFAKNGADEDIDVVNGIPEDDSNNIQYICADEFQVDYIQSHMEGTETVVNSYCSVIPGGDYNTITGTVIFDFNSDGCDAIDPIYPYIKLNINDDIIFSNALGEYHFYTGEGSFDVTPEFENQSWFNASPASSNVTFTEIDNTINTQNFCITPNGINNDLEIILSPIVEAQPGFDAVYQITYKNKGNQTLSGEIDFTFDDDVFDYVTSSVSISSQTIGTLFWNYTDLSPFESRSIMVTLNVNSPMETPAVNIGDLFSFGVSINPAINDETPPDNLFDYKQTVIGSFDPNDITCLEGEIVSPNEIGKYLHYNINFENTGTAAATFVVVKDVIDEASYDMSSFQIIYASHEMQTTITDNTVEFRFDNINLGPNELGNIIFKIKTQNSLTVGDSVSNQAEIFFDYNFPIVTNVATTSFQILSVDEFDNEAAISVFPNPSKDLVTFISKTKLKSIQVYDTMSRLVFETAMDASNHTLNVSDYSEGIYFLKLKTASGEHVERFIKN